MKNILLFILLSGLSCNSKNQEQGKHNIADPCPPDWIATGKQLKQTMINDTTERAFLNDTLWFEVIGHSRYKKNQYMSYLKNYRTNGLIKDEGIALYFDHPVADYVEHGEWKYYDCKGDLVETKIFFEGKLVNAN
jgi:hypothetical protein